jgi:glycosyltransferase involved in cell wall biosynthesis
MEGGGSERQLLYLMRGLDRSQFGLALYLLYQSGALINDVPSDIPVTSFWTNRRIPRINWPGRFHGQQVKDLAARIRSFGADIVYDRLFHMTMISGPASRSTGVKRVSTIVSPPSRDVMRSELKLVWLKRLLLSRAYANSDRLLAVSSVTADDAAKFYRIPRGKFQVVPSAVDIDRIDAMAAKKSEGPTLVKDRLHVITIGRLSEEKGHVHLLNAVAKLRRTSSQKMHLHVVGDGPLRASLESQAESLGIADRTSFYGHIQNPYVVLAQCDLLCLPSLYEGMPNVLIEAMACRIPALAAETAGAARELLDNGRRGTLVATPDADLISEAIRDRMEQPEKWLSRIEPARQYVEQTHSLPRWLDDMQKIFCEVASGKREQ